MIMIIIIIIISAKHRIVRIVKREEVLVKGCHM